MSALFERAPLCEKIVKRIRVVARLLSRMGDASTDWLAWLDDCLLSTGHVASAAICKADDGQPLAYSSAYNVQPSEVAEVMKHIGAPAAGLATRGAILAGDYHLFLNGEAHGDMYFRRGDNGFFFRVCADPLRADPLGVVVVAGHDTRRGMQAGPCRAAVHALAERLNGTQPARDEGGRWPIVVDPHDKSGDDVPPLTPEE